jgi:hypothetical protein
MKGYRENPGDGGAGRILGSRLCLLAFVAVCVFTASARAEVWSLGGHVKYQFTYTDYRADDLAAVLGDDPARDHGVDIRLKAERRTGPWDFVAHYEFLAVSGDTLEARRRMAALGLPATGTAAGLPDDRRRLFDLTDEITDRERRAAVHRLDRLSVGHRTPRQVLRFGRQVISWGNGLVFHPLDFVNPFSPVAIDKEYKTGDDMFHGQWRVGERDDVQAIILPRRDPVTRSLKSNQSSYAVKLRTRAAGFDLDFLAARHFDENLAGLGVVRSVGGAVWRLDAGYVDLKNGGAFSLVTNLDYSWTWGGKNVYGYVEYFRNGVGTSDRAGYVSPDPALAARIARGELFTLARDYAALGLQVELTPLLNLYTILIQNLDDGSRFLQVRGVYDWTQNTRLMLGVNFPSGDRGDEFGGIPTGVGGAYLAPGRSVFVRAAYYF